MSRRLRVVRLLRLNRQSKAMTSLMFRNYTNVGLRSGSIAAHTSVTAARSASRCKRLPGYREAAVLYLVADERRVDHSQRAVKGGAADAANMTVIETTRCGRSTKMARRPVSGGAGDPDVRSRRLRTPFAEA